MPIIRVQEQGTESLKGFYDFLSSQNNAFGATRDSMLRLLHQFNEEFPNQTFYALTSHARLIILEGKDILSNHLATFSSSAFDEYDIETGFLGDENPRTVAHVTGAGNAIQYFKTLLDTLPPDRFVP